MPCATSNCIIPCYLMCGVQCVTTCYLMHFSGSLTEHSTNQVIVFTDNYIKQDMRFKMDLQFVILIKNVFGSLH